jgi:TfoX/Sxy family transcriptional regulator of competence genes
MAYDEDLADRIRALVGSESATEMRMFGGLAFLINGNMAVAASGQGGLMVRVDPADAAKLLTEPEAEPMVMRGRELAGWLLVDTTGLTTRKQLKSWVDRGIAYARSLPAKKRR